MASKIEMEVELKSEAEKVWKSMRESTTLFPKALPQHYQSIQILEGDGKAVNSVRLVTYPQGISGAASSIKEKIETVDEEKKFVSYSVIEGDILTFYKNFKGSLSVGSKADSNGTCLKWTCEFDKVTPETPEPDFVKDFAFKTFQDLDAYIIAN